MLPGDSRLRMARICSVLESAGRPARTPHPRAACRTTWRTLGGDAVLKQEDNEGRRIRSHVRDGRRAARNVGPPQQSCVPARHGAGGGDVATDAVDVAERGDAAAGGSTARGPRGRTGCRSSLRDGRRGRAGRTGRACAPSRRSAVGPRPPAIPCTRAGPCREGSAAGRGARRWAPRQAEAAGDHPAGETDAAVGRRGTAADVAHPGARVGHPVRVRRRVRSRAGVGVGSMQEKGPRGPADQHPVGVAHRRLPVGDLLGHPRHVAAQQIDAALHSRAHALRLHLERAPGAARPGRAALMAKFMLASSTREWMPAWVIP